MDFLSRMMSFGKKLGSKKTKSEPSSECVKICELQDKINALLKSSNYVARSEYAQIIPVYKETVEEAIISTLGFNNLYVLVAVVNRI